MLESIVGELRKSLHYEWSHVWRPKFGLVKALNRFISHTINISLCLELLTTNGNLVR